MNRTLNLGTRFWTDIFFRKNNLFNKKGFYKKNEIKKMRIP